MNNPDSVLSRSIAFTRSDPGDEDHLSRLYFTLVLRDCGKYSVFSANAHISGHIGNGKSQSTLISDRQAPGSDGEVQTV
jgi:hypothetical protein